MPRVVLDRLLFIAYIFERLLFRFWEFIRRWYAGAAMWFWRKTLERLQSLDRRIALKVTVIYFFRPLFGDESVIGRLLGFFFRTLRIVFASALYLVILAAAAFAYLLWALFPVFVISKIVLP